MTIQAVIFDLDGTITEPILDFDAIRREIGLEEEAGPLLEAMEAMRPSERRRAEAILAEHERGALAASTLNPGARELLVTLGERGIRVGILTRNTRANAQAVADKHGLCFEAIVGRDQAPVKPDPAGVSLLCRRFGVPTRRSVVVGDYLFDILCAKAAGATSVLLDQGRGAGRYAHVADFTVEKLNQLPHIIDRLDAEAEGS